MDDTNKELSNEEILKQMKEHLDEAAKKYSFSYNDQIDQYIENLKKFDYVEDAYRDPNDKKFIHIICNKPITCIHVDLIVPKEEGEQQDG